MTVINIQNPKWIDGLDSKTRRVDCTVVFKEFLSKYPNGLETTVLMTPLEQREHLHTIYFTDGTSMFLEEYIDTLEVVPCTIS